MHNTAKDGLRDLRGRKPSESRKPDSEGNPQQQEAIMHGAGPMMVLAGPGSGKTFVLTRRIAHLINTHHIGPSEILVITFTKAAAGEMQQRFLSLCEGEHPPVTFGTFHAVFYSILKETSRCRTGSILSESEKKKILQDIIRKNRYNINPNADVLEEILSEIGRYKSRCFPGNDISEKRSTCESACYAPDKEVKENMNYIPQNISPELFRKLYQDFTRAQEIIGKIDFDDMALKCLELFQERPDILKQYQARYRYLLIDEFQDIAPIQYRLVRLLAAPENNLFIVGDDDQSIYGFRGAKPDIMRHFPKEYPSAKIVALQINYRSTPQVVSAAGKLIGHNRNRFPKEISAAKEPGAPLRITGTESVEQMEEALIRCLLPEKNAGKLADCAVISRTSARFPMLSEKLRQAGIPCMFREKVKSIYDHEIAYDLLAYLEFAVTPPKERSRSQFFRFMNRPLRYISREAVNESADFGHLIRYYRGKPGIQEAIIRLKQDLERISTMPVFLALNYIRRGMGYDLYLAERFGVHSMQNNKEGKCNLPEKENVHISELADMIQNSARGCRTLSQWKEIMEERRKETQSGTSTPKEGVTLLTMHGSKGLEYDKVFIVNCNEGSTPHRKARGEEEIEEERRMFYVAMTRAKKELTMFCITEEKSANKEGSTAKTMPPSRFLKEIE